MQDLDGNARFGRGGVETFVDRAAPQTPTLAARADAGAVVTGGVAADVKQRLLTAVGDVERTGKFKNTTGEVRIAVDRGDRARLMEVSQGDVAVALNLGALIREYVATIAEAVGASSRPIIVDEFEERAQGKTRLLGYLGQIRGKMTDRDFKRTSKKGKREWVYEQLKRLISEFITDRSDKATLMEAAGWNDTISGQMRKLRTSVDVHFFCLRLGSTLESEYGREVKEKLPNFAHFLDSSER